MKNEAYEYEHFNYFLRIPHIKNSRLKIVNKKKKPKIFLLNLIINAYFYIPFDSKLIALSEFMTIFVHVCILKKNFPTNSV
jgi:hypothetical protein